MPLEKGMTIRTNILAPRILRTKEPGRLQVHRITDTTEATQHAHRKRNPFFLQ